MDRLSAGEESCGAAEVFQSPVIPRSEKIYNDFFPSAKNEILERPILHKPMERTERLDSLPGHRDRMREKFFNGGLDGFLDYEIVELLISLGTPRRDCRTAAKLALKRFRTLAGVLEAGPDELQRVEGLGRRNIIGLRLVQEVARRYLREKMMEKPFFESSREVFEYLYHCLREKKREQFKVIFLDTKNRIIDEKTIFEGTVDSSAVYPREIVKDALDFSASALIFVHNHPSGDPTPSRNDMEITKDLVFAARLIQIKVLDHIIIGNNRYFSFADRGLIQQYEDQFLKALSF